MSDRTRICATSPTVSFVAKEACQPVSNVVAAPIDDYYGASVALTLLGTQQALVSSRALGRLVLLGHVSATEAYVRAILVRLIQICPVSREHAGTQNVTFSSFDYYGPSEAAYGLLDGHSLASSQELQKAVRRLTNINVTDSAAVKAILEKFDDVCHLRHAAVHAHGSISTTGASTLGLTGGGQRFEVMVDFSTSQSVASICRSLVQELNQALFLNTVRCWKATGRLSRDFEADQSIFSDLLSLFTSTKDATNSGEALEDIYNACLFGTQE